MFEISMHTSGLRGLNLEMALGTAARLGFRAVDLDASFIDPKRAVAQPKAEMQTIREMLREFNLRLADIYLELPNLNSPDPEKRKTDSDRFDRLIPFLLQLHPGGITIVPGSAHEDGPDHTFARALIGLLEIYQTAQLNLAGIRVTVEPQPVWTPGSASIYRTLQDCIPGVRLTVDLAYLAFIGAEHAQQTAILSNASHIHLRQAAKERFQTGFEYGNIDLKVLVEDLRTLGYQGTVAIDYLNTPGDFGAIALNVIAETVKTRDALRKLRQVANPA